MRNPGVDYVRLFQMHALVPLKTDEEYVESTARLAWLEDRTDVTESAKDYASVLRLIIKDYEDRKEEGHLPPLPNDPPVDDGESGEELIAKRKPGRPRKES